MTAALIAGMVVLGIINLMLLFFVFTLFKDNSALKLLVTQTHIGLGNLTTRILNQESYLQKVGTTFSEFTNIMEELVDKFDNSAYSFNPNSKMGMMYRTLDGKYAAKSLEDLISKIKQDGTEDDYLSTDELNNLRKMFESADNPFDNADNDEDFEDDEDDDEFNPDQGKL